MASGCRAPHLEPLASRRCINLARNVVHTTIEGLHAMEDSLASAFLRKGFVDRGRGVNFPFCRRSYHPLPPSLLHPFYPKLLFSLPCSHHSFLVSFISLSTETHRVTSLKQLPLSLERSEVRFLIMFQDCSILNRLTSLLFYHFI